MGANQPSNSDPSFAGRGVSGRASRNPPRSEDIYMRNYDPYWGYDLEVTVRRSDEAVFESSYYFQPGEIKSVGNVIPAGEYEVTVELDNHREKTTACRVSSAPDHTIHVELGNGTVSLTEGLY